MSALDDLLDNEHSGLHGETPMYPVGHRNRVAREKRARIELDALRADLLAANERAKTLRPILRRCADALADEVAVLVCRQVIDSRSPAADALLDYKNDCLNPQLMISPRADRIADLEVDLLAAEEQITQLRGDLRALRCGADAEFQAALADAVNDEVLS